MPSSPTPSSHSRTIVQAHRAFLSSLACVDACSLPAKQPDISSPIQHDAQGLLILRRRLICVTINDGNDWADHKKLLTEGFAQFSTQKLVCRHQQVGTRCVLGGEKAEVALIAMDDFYYPVAPGEQISFLLPQRDFAFAPVVAGADAGCVYICIDQKPVGKVALEYGETIEIQTSEDPKLPKRWLGG